MNRPRLKDRVPVRKNHGGRPSLEDSARLTEHIIDRATSVFLRDGFEATSIDMIAAEATISKRTFYTRFDNKADLFAAVVIRFVEKRMARLDAIGTGPGRLRPRLEAAARELLLIASEADTIALDRVMTAEVARFPELGRTLYDFGVSRAAGLIRTILDQAVAKGELGPIDTKHAAEHFLFATVIGPMRILILGVEGNRLSGARLEKLHQSVDLFLNGLPRQATSSRRPRRSV
jgi:TetR/AcrR family transcriptional regulator, mexJK operon transcriptional repressor